MRELAFVFVLLLAGCAGSPTQPSAPAAADEGDCTAETPLVEGVPGSPGHLIPSEINPNGASELAALMRTMQSDLRAAREGLEQGQSLPLMFPRHRKIRCSWPTRPSFRDESFDQFAQAYLAQVKAFDVASGDRRQAYSAVIAACHACHTQSCPGPIPAIEALRLPSP